MSNNKFSGISPLNEKNDVIHASGQKSRIFNDYFASKSNLQGKMDDPPIRAKKDYPELTLFNTSPLDTGGWKID